METLSLRRKRYRIRFPSGEPLDLAQDQTYFFLEENGQAKQLRFHDYDQLYLRPGLYEQLFYDRLKCSSPKKVAQLLKKVVDETGGSFTELRVLDVGAGNGMMGETLADYGVARLIGIDIVPEAAAATERDRPGLYDAYYVADLTSLGAEEKIELQNWKLDCVTTVAALGFGDIPPQAFLQAVNLMETNGWIAFNIKETFLDNRDTSGFSIFIKNLILTEYIDIHHIERYRHRIGIDGKPLYYFAVIARKSADVPEGFLSSIGVTSQ
jgi:SAM-dependent methyltransferase